MQDLTLETSNNASLGVPLKVTKEGILGILGSITIL